MKGFIALILAAVLAFVVWVAIGGQDTKVPDAPNPKVPLPKDPGDAADKTWNFIDAAPQWVWTQVAPIVIVGIILAMIAKKFPKASYILLGAFIATIVIFVVVLPSR